MFGWGRKDKVELRFDRTPQVLALTAPEDRVYHEEPPLSPVPRLDEFLSASVLAHKAKQVDDRIYAAVERAATPGILAILKRWVAAGAPDVVAAAAKLGGLDVRAPEELLRDFLSDDLRSKPISFYTWDEELGRVFRRDRMLQSDLKGPDAEFARRAHADPEWARHLALIQRLTNPFASGPPRVLPPSQSHESELVKRMFGDRPIPEGFDLLNELIRRIREGTLDLRPRPESGWYDHQAWALEPLLRLEEMPEAARLRIDAEYRKTLEGLFKGILALTRETHAKQIEIPRAGCGPPGEEPEPIVTVVPELDVEPLVTHYRRRADSYRFLRDVLRERKILPDEVEPMISLFDRAAASAGRQLGLGGEGELKIDPQDPDLAKDGRMMVPVFHDLQRKKTKVWAFLGWSDRPLTITFAVPPKVDIVRGRARIEFGEKHVRLAFPVCEELYVTRILDRDEFRAHCDRHRTRDKILSALQ